MFLTQAIVATDGTRHPMAGVLPTDARMHAKLQAIGYVEVELRGDSILGAAGARFRGHQFRYSELSPSLEPARIEHAYAVRRRYGDPPSVGSVGEGYRLKNVVASYVHAHWASNPEVPAALVRACVRFRQERER
jgi:cobyrinic acid a,c-diamide synthase